MRPCGGTPRWVRSVMAALGLMGIAATSVAEPAPSTPSSGVGSPGAGSPGSLFLGSLGELPEADRGVLAELLGQAGIKQAKVRSVERSPERQVRVMLQLATEDLEHAKAMYCQAGDEVLTRFDPKATREQNQSAMLEALLAVLPKAREMGCLNHVRNDDVITVDVETEGMSEAQQAALAKAGEGALAAKKVERFLAPPREPNAFHFEFQRRAAAPVESKPPANQPPIQ